MSHDHWKTRRRWKAALCPTISETPQEIDVASAVEGPGEDRTRSQILADVLRHVPEADQREIVTRILMLYLRCEDNLGYAQGMTYIVEVLMEVLSDERDAFRAFVTLMSEQCLGGLFKGSSPPLLQQCKRDLRTYLAIEAPDMEPHLDKIEMISEMWFRSLFMQALPMDSTIQFVDTLVCNGFHFLAPLAVNLVVSQKDTLLALDWNGVGDFFKDMRSGKNSLDVTNVIAMATSAPYACVPAESYSCFCAHGLTQRMSTWHIAESVSKDEMETWNTLWKNHSRAIVKIRGEGPYRQVIWHYMWIPKSGWHKKFIVDKILSTYDTVLGSVGDVVDKNGEPFWQALASRMCAEGE